MCLQASGLQLVEAALRQDLQLDSGLPWVSGSQAWQSLGSGLGFPLTGSEKAFIVHVAVVGAFWSTLLVVGVTSKVSQPIQLSSVIWEKEGPGLIDRHWVAILMQRVNLVIKWMGWGRADRCGLVLEGAGSNRTLRTCLGGKVR